MRRQAGAKITHRVSRIYNERAVAEDTAQAVEQVYHELRGGEWLAALNRLSRLLSADQTDDNVERAARVYVDELFREDTLRTVLPQAQQSVVFEKLLLLDESGRLSLDGDRREQIVLDLVRSHEAEPELAASFARFMPDHPECSRLLEALDAPTRNRVTAAGAAVAIDSVGVSDVQTAVRSIFRSKLERRFYRAALRVFPAHFVQPNAALQAMIDFERVRDALSEDERAYFFRCLIDLAVLDPEDDYRPAYLFEIDSVMHDDRDASERDRMKDAIINAAGARLYRIRPADFRVSTGEIEAALRRFVRTD